MINVFFATNRNLTGRRANPDFGEGFHRDGPAALRFGLAEVPPACFDDDKRLEDIRITVFGELLKSRKPRLGSETAFAEVRHKMRKHARDTVVFIHGYANTFRNALRHAAWLKVTYDAVPFNVVLFSWPSNGEMVPLMSYYSDRTDAKASGPAMARALLKLHDFLGGSAPEEWCDQRLHVMAHSMGTYAFRHAVQGVRGELGDEPPRLFDTVFLFAADEDDDAFEHDHKYRLLPRLARQVAVYFNPGDRALVVSDVTKRNPDRLGSDGPRLLDDLPRKVVLLDCRAVAGTDPRDRHGHDYHRYGARAIADINAVLKGTPPDQIPGRTFQPAARAYRLEPA